MSEKVESGVVAAAAAMAAVNAAEANAIPEEVQTAWKAFVEYMAPVAAKHKLMCFGITCVLGMAEGEKAKLLVLSTAALPNSTDLEAVKNLSVMVVRSLANVCAAEVARIAAASVAEGLKDAGLAESNPAPTQAGADA